MDRTLSRIDDTPPPAPGFIGPGHTAVEVLAPDELEHTDPFVLLMDDRLDIPRRRQIGAAHPHAGLETVTLVLEGSLHDRDEGELSAGDLVWMTAGAGIIHNEAVEAVGRSRILQLWIGLPSVHRNAAPHFKVVRRESAPVLRQPGVTAHLYSGSIGTLRAQTRNLVPVTLMDVALEIGATFRAELAENQRGFFYVVEGEVTVAGQPVRKGQVGWLTSGATGLSLTAGDGPARVVLYTGEPNGEPLVQQGPFVAGSRAEIVEHHRRFRAGEFVSMSALVRAAQSERRTA